MGFRVDISLQSRPHGVVMITQFSFQNSALTEVPEHHTAPNLTACRFTKGSHDLERAACFQISSDRNLNSLEIGIKVDKDYQHKMWNSGLVIHSTWHLQWYMCDWTLN